MGEWITAQLGDSFCTLAAMRGFADCRPVRDHAANVDIRGKALEPNDVVYIPDLVERSDSAPTERRHIFVRATTFAAIRFVRGLAGAIPADPTINTLNISNYRTDRAGANGTDAFAGPNHWQFHAASAADPDTFKVEVTDNRAAGATLNIMLEALHPVYVAGILIRHDLNWSSAAEAARRRQQVRGHRATPLPDQRYRTAYLRLVVDEADKASRQQQTLLVTDDQPNEEEVEILDQKVRATYIIPSCPVNVGGPAQCRVVAEADVGTNKQRIKLCVGILCRNPGDAAGPNPVGIRGITEAHIRHRLFRWFRRVYAQANMAPVLVAPGIRFLDPPDRNLLTVSDVSGARAHGITSAGTSPSRMSFRITTDRGGGVTVVKDVPVDIARAANVAARLRPIEVANLIVAAVNDADFTAQAFENAASIGFAATRRSADILIRDTAGGKVTISNVRNNDRGANFRLATVNLNAYQMSSGVADLMGGTRHERQLLRNYDSGTDRLDCYVIGKFDNGATTRGRSYVPGMNTIADFRPPPEIVNSCVMGSTSSSGRVMNGSNNLPYTFPHEAGHALIDCFHTSRRSELMASGGTSQTPTMRGTKRICDVPVNIVYQNFINGTTNLGGTYFYFAATRLGTIVPAIFEPW